jgi:hypothetical protein
MNTLAAKIKSKGYWRIRIRPTEYMSNRIANISDLHPLVQRLAVDIRGWDFPHADFNSVEDLSIHQSYVTQQTDWEHFIEQWRIYQSGQFAYVGALVTDWPSRFSHFQADSMIVWIEDAIAKYIEVLEFAARLCASPAGANRMWIEVGVYGLRDRHLATTSAMAMFLRGRTATYADDKFVLQEEFSREQLLAEAEQIAFRWSQELFRRFNWDPEHEVLEGIRGQFRQTQRAS